MGLVPGLFLDRDGVVNEEVNFLHLIADARFMPGIFHLIRTARARGMKIAIVTNQSGIGQGFYTQAHFDELMVWMRAEMAKEGADVDAVYHCPHHPTRGLGEYLTDCECRKPTPGMLLQGAEDLGIDLSQSIIVGDRCTDLQVGHAAGVEKTFLIRGVEAAGCPGVEHIKIDSLDEVTRWIETRYPFLGA